MSSSLVSKFRLSVILLFASVLASLLVFLYSVVTEVTALTESTASSVSRELDLQVEKIALFAEFSSGYVSDANEETLQNRINRLIFGMAGVKSLELTVPARRLFLRNTYSASGLYLNSEAPLSTCEFDKSQQRTMESEKYGEFSLQVCGDGTLLISKDLEQNDSVVATIALISEPNALITEPFDAVRSFDLRLTSTPPKDLQCSTDPKNWCMLKPRAKLYSKVAEKSIHLFIQLVLLFAICSWIFVKIVLIPIQKTRMALKKIAKGEPWTDVPGSLGMFFSEMQKSISELAHIASENLKLREQAASEKARVLIARQVAHDIRSPLLALQSVEKNLGSTTERDRSTVRNAVLRISEISNSLLNLSRTEVVSLAPAKPHFVRPIIDEVVGELNASLSSRSKRLKIHVDCEEGAKFIKVMGVAPDLKRAFSNILNNGVEASPDGGAVTVSIFKDAQFVCIDVVDDGPGFSERILPMIGTEGISSKPSGNGLGLNQAIRAIKTAGGDVHFENMPMAGACVRVRMPIATLKQDASPSKLATLVLIDDDILVRETWKQEAERLHMEIWCYETVEGLFSDLPKISTLTPIYVDVELYGEKRGLDVASELIKRGYQNVSLATGYERSALPVIPGLKAIHGKDFPLQGRELTV
jgi:signal transduction histidine kinase